jgi:hypothetical protein
MNPERLAYWYFRLNGFLTTENFIVHPDQGAEQRTDADLFAVRFAHRAENLLRPMKDDPAVITCQTFVNVIISEIKTGKCMLNGPWTRPERQNMQRVLKAMGCVPDAGINITCEDLYQRGAWADATTTIRLFAIGEERNDALRLHGKTVLPATQQITWSEIIEFLVRRFTDYRGVKSSVGQWTADGKALQKAALSGAAAALIRHKFRLNPASCENGGAK